MGAWREYFTWLLGVAVSIVGWAVNRTVKRWDKLQETVERHDRQIQVLISLNERRGDDDRRHMLADYVGPDKRHAERRS